MDNSQHTPGPQFPRLKAEFDALAKSLMLCVSACQCPTCGAQAEKPCRSKSGAVCSTHSTRSKAGHALLATPVQSAADRMFKAMHAEQPERIAKAIAAATGSTHE